MVLRQVTRLRYTPRKFVVHPESNMLIVAEADHAAVPLADRRAVEDGMETDAALTEVRGLQCLTLNTDADDQLSWDF